jgi:hypothetical protein
MFGNRNRNQRGSSITKTIVNITTIASTAMTCIRLAYHGILSIQLAALIMLGVVVFLALGNNLAKILLTVIALFLFCKVYAQGDKTLFLQLLAQMFTLIIVLIGLYIMVRGFFRR